MSYKYTDEQIPKRPYEDGKNGRPVRGADADGGSRASSDFGSGHTASGYGGGRVSSDLGSMSSSRWNLITEEELYAGNRRRHRVAGGADVPEMIAKLLKMTEDYQITDEGRAEAFLKQAEFMEPYEMGDDRREGISGRPFAEYHHMYIGYQEMSVQELKEYFRWRTGVRHKEKVPYNSGFALLHASEMIALSGEDNKAETFEDLLKLQAVVRKQLEGQINRRFLMRETEQTKLRKIIQEYAIVWMQDPEILQEYSVEDIGRESDNITLLHVESSNDFSVYSMISHLVEHRVLNSKFIQQAGEDAGRVIARSFRRLCRMQKEKVQSSLAERLLGRQRERRIYFYQSLPCKAPGREGYSVSVSPVTSYYCKNGEWHKRFYAALRDEKALSDLNEFVRECERVLRRKMHFKNQLPDRMKDPETANMIAQEIDGWMKEKTLRNRPEVHVDLSKLSAIRSMADITRERLLEGTQEGEEADLFSAMNTAVHDEAEGVTADTALSAPTEEISGSVDGADTTSIAGASGSADGSYTAPTDETLGSVDGADTADGAGVGCHPDDSDAAGAVISENAGMTDGDDMSGGPANEEGIFSGKEREFLELLLNGGNGAEYFKAHTIIPSVFVDAINEKAYDEIGDSIVEEDGRSWRLVEDYIDDVRQMLGEN